MGRGPNPPPTGGRGYTTRSFWGRGDVFLEIRDRNRSDTPVGSKTPREKIKISSGHRQGASGEGRKNTWTVPLHTTRGPVTRTYSSPGPVPRRSLYDPVGGYAGPSLHGPFSVSSTCSVGSCILVVCSFLSEGGRVPEESGSEGEECSTESGSNPLPQRRPWGSGPDAPEGSTNTDPLPPHTPRVPYRPFPQMPQGLVSTPAYIPRTHTDPQPTTPRPSLDWNRGRDVSGHPFGPRGTSDRRGRHPHSPWAGTPGTYGDQVLTRGAP